MIVAIFATSFLSAHAQESDGASLPFKGVVDFSMNSSRVSYGLVVRDAPVSVFRARLSDFNVGDSVVPIFVDMTCKNAISSPSRYPEEKFGDTVELNGSTGMEWSRYVKLEDNMCMSMQWYHWTYPSTHRPPLDAVILDTRLKTWLSPGILVRYRFHGLSKGRIETRLSIRGERNVWDEFKVFGYLNSWIVDYSHERRNSASGASAGELALGVAWRIVYFRTSYWFPLDRRVLDDGPPNYDHRRNVVFSLGARVSF